jgi:hypothetical protein
MTEGDSQCGIALPLTALIGGGSMVMNVNPSSERLTFLMEHGPEHLRPIFRAVRDYGVTLTIALQGQGTLWPPMDQGTILMICDDDSEAKGPTAFHQSALRDFVRTCRLAVIVSCEPLTEVYTIAAITAILTRRNIIVIETNLKYEQAWRDLIETESPDLRLVIATVEPQAGLH